MWEVDLCLSEEEEPEGLAPTPDAPVARALRGGANALAAVVAWVARAWRELTGGRGLAGAAAATTSADGSEVIGAAANAAGDGSGAFWAHAGLPKTTAKSGQSSVSFG